MPVGPLAINRHLLREVGREAAVDSSLQLVTGRFRVWTNWLTVLNCDPISSALQFRTIKGQKGLKPWHGEKLDCRTSQLDQLANGNLSARRKGKIHCSIHLDILRLRLLARMEVHRSIRARCASGATHLAASTGGRARARMDRVNHVETERRTEPATNLR